MSGAEEQPLDAGLQAEADAVLAELDGPAAIDAAPAVEQKNVEMSEVLAQFFGVTFNLLVAPRAGAHWKMSDAECNALGKAYGAIVDKYWPDLDLGVEIAAVLITVTVIGPRVKIDRELRAAKEAKRDDATAGNDA